MTEKFDLGEFVSVFSLQLITLRVTCKSTTTMYGLGLPSPLLLAASLLLIEVDWVCNTATHMQQQ